MSPYVLGKVYVSTVKQAHSSNASVTHYLPPPTVHFVRIQTTEIIYQAVCALKDTKNLWMAYATLVLVRWGIRFALIMGLVG